MDDAIYIPTYTFALVVFYLLCDGDGRLLDPVGRYIEHLRNA